MKLNLLILAALLLAACTASPTTQSVTLTAPSSTPKPVTLTLPPAVQVEGCTAPSEATVKFLALGDSYTIGESVEPALRWPLQLADLLRAQGFTVDAPQIIARTGWTTDELSAAIDQADPQGPYELVSLLIGVNNQYRGRDAEEYRGEFAVLLQRAIGFAGGQPPHVLVLSIPDWGVTPFGSNGDPAKIAAEIDTYNAINKEESEKAGVRYVDITPISRQAASDPSLVADDGLHPSGSMYTQWAELALPAACEALKIS